MKCWIFGIKQYFINMQVTCLPIQWYKPQTQNVLSIEFFKQSESCSFMFCILKTYIWIGTLVRTDTQVIQLHRNIWEQILFDIGFKFFCSGGKRLKVFLFRRKTYQTFMQAKNSGTLLILSLIAVLWWCSSTCTTIVTYNDRVFIDNRILMYLFERIYYCGGVLLSTWEHVSGNMSQT